MISERFSAEFELVPGCTLLLVSVSRGRKRLGLRPQGLTDLGSRTGVTWMALPLLRPICRAISGLAGELTEEHDFTNHRDRAWSCDGVTPPVFQPWDHKRTSRVTRWPERK